MIEPHKNPDEPGSNEVVEAIRRHIESEGSRDEVLRAAVRLLKGARSHYDWVGIYLLEGDTLTLHNYVGKPTDHVRITVGTGVCGTAVSEGANQIVDDVTKLDNYLACSAETRSEIVILIKRGDVIIGQIDIDSDRAGAFSRADESMLVRVADLLATRF